MDRPREPRPAPAPPPVRLTRRGRVVLVAFAAIVLLVLFWLTMGPGAGAQDRGTPPGSGGHRVEYVVVEPGQTLWEIAVRVSGDGDPRLTVQRIIDLNGLPGPIVQPGQRLRMPAR
ncbi:LysM peptidoglycan-binding domain-containing protein [Spirillospora sp. CA-253888]